MTDDLVDYTELKSLITTYNNLLHESHGGYYPHYFMHNFSAMPPYVVRNNEIGYDGKTKYNLHKADEIVLLYVELSKVLDGEIL